LRRDQPPDLVQVEEFERQFADVQVAAMGRVERTAQQSDAAMPSGRRPDFRLTAQGRTCPVPRTRYLYVVSCSGPTGPRGGKGLVARVQAEARVPIFAHLEGVVHIYVDKAADLEMARTIVMNAKMRRTGVCGAAETLLVDRAAAPTMLKPLIAMLIDAGCEVRGDADVQKADSRAKAASEDDWPAEYLDAIIAAKIVDGVDAAIAHIERYGSHHTDAIITEDKSAAEKFLREVDSAIVLHNASTQFADGGEFGFGAEIGIATGRLHARGPVGVEQLTTFKYRIRGSGQTRP